MYHSRYFGFSKWGMGLGALPSLISTWNEDSLIVEDVLKYPRILCSKLRSLEGGFTSATANVCGPSF